jgi:hypothetical protein
VAKYAIYGPPSLGLPHLAVVIANGKIIACKAVASYAEGNSLLKDVKQSMPEFFEKAGRVRH